MTRFFVAGSNKEYEIILAHQNENINKTTLVGIFSGFCIKITLPVSLKVFLKFWLGISRHFYKSSNAGGLFFDFLSADGLF